MFWLVEHDENPIQSVPRGPATRHRGGKLPDNVIELVPRDQRRSEGPRITWIGPIDAAEAHRLASRIARKATIQPRARGTATGRRHPIE